MQHSTTTQVPERAATRHTPRRKAGLVARIVLSLMALGTVAGVTAEPANAAYTYYHTDSFGFWDSTGSKVWVQGQVDWYYDGWLAPVYRGQYRSGGGTYVVLNTTGCMWVKVTWHTVTGSVSWPPSGAANRVSDGYYRACGTRGTWINLGGVAYASHTLHATTICIGYSTNSSYTLRRYDACKKMYW